jgi:nitrate reductase NapE component
MCPFALGHQIQVGRRQEIIIYIDIILFFSRFLVQGGARCGGFEFIIKIYQVLRIKSAGNKSVQL